MSQNITQLCNTEKKKILRRKRKKLNIKWHDISGIKGNKPLPPKAE
jgi:hypothetical protein